MDRRRPFSDRKISLRSIFKTAGEAAGEAASKHLRLSKKFSMRFQDLEVGEELGKGGFCDVHEVKYQGKAKGALKRLSVQRKTPHDIVEGAVDLATEAAILTNFSHENIIHVHGMAAGPINQSVASEDGFFVVMEKLEKTLTQQISEWKKEPETRPTRHGQLLDRLDAALQLARAIQYIHSQKVVHRDLKPDNVGFDDKGVLKVFDFGFAIKLRPDRPLHGVAGTQYYMAPEMASRCAYDQSVDVYSFGLLLWEVCALEQVYHGMSPKAHMRRVIQGNERPRIRMWWPSSLKSLIKKCWSEKPSSRPNINVVVTTLESLVAKKDEKH